MNIKRRVSTTIVFSLTLLFLGSLVAGVWIWQTRIAIRTSTEIDALVTDLYELRILSLEYEISPLDRTLQQWRAKYAQIGAAIAGGAQIPREVSDAFVNMNSIFSRIQAMNAARGNLGIHGLRLSKQLYVSLHIESQRIVDWALAISDETRETFLDRSEKFGLGTMGILILIASINTLFLFFGGRYVLKAIGTLGLGTERIAQGELDHVIEMPGDDEMSRLAGSFNAMSRDLRESCQQLRNAKELTENIIHGASVMIVGLDANGLVTMLNGKAEALTGYSLAEMKGRSWFGTVAPDEVLTGDGMQAGGAFENRICTTQGEMLTVSWLNNPLMAGGEVVGTICFGIDMTEHRKLEEMHRQTLKMETIGRLAGGVAHDFNNMLTVILASAELAREPGTDNEQLQLYLNHVTSAAERSRDITRQLLAFSRKEVIAPRPVNLGHLILDTRKTLVRLIGEDVILSCDSSEDLWSVNIDPSQVDQILVNLAVNARDAMPDGGLLAIRTDNLRLARKISNHNLVVEPGEYVRLTFKDSGSGMPAEIMEHIFEPFFTTKGVGKGTGLGLATVYGIVAQNKGIIEVESAPGEGTVFTLCFPRIEWEQKSNPVVETSLAPGSGGVLLVEDDELVRNMTGEMLKSSGYSVIQAAGPEEALQVCARAGEEIDLILTDVVMPGMNGREMAERILATRPDIKVIYMSGYSADLVEERGIAENTMPFIQKPFDLARLREKIREVMHES